MVAVVAMAVWARGLPTVSTAYITAESMAPNLLPGDMIVVLGWWRFGESNRRPLRSHQRGDVIFFAAADGRGGAMVKRLVGLPGDTLEMIDGQLILNGEPQIEPYIISGTHVDLVGHPRMLAVMSWHPDLLPQNVDPASYVPSRDNWGPLVMPPDRYFVLGDNRDLSIDSRYWGPIEGWRIRGKARVIYFSLVRAQTSDRALTIRWARLGKRIS